MTEALQIILARLDAIAAPKRFCSIASAAKYCDLSEDSLRRLIERGDLTAHRPVRGKILIDREELDRLILGSAGPVRGSRGSATRTRLEGGQ
jgi:excisionase family DNA binding protein